MGQHQPLMQGPKPHPLSNASHIKTLLLWSSAIVLPFMVLICLFPWGASELYKPSVNRIVVSQFQIPRIQSGGLIESKRSSDDAPLLDDNPPIDRDIDGSGDEAATNLLTSKDENKQINPSTEAVLKETGATSITEVDRLPSSAAKMQNLESMTKLLSADEGNLSSSKPRKQSDGGKEKKHNDGHEDSNPGPKKAKKRNDEDDDTTNDGDKSEINAFIVEREVNEENGEKKKKKKSELNGESDTKDTGNWKTMQFSAEEMPEIELERELSIPGKKEEAMEPNIAEVESKKSSKKNKAMHDTDESDLNVEEDTIASKAKKSSKKAKAMRDKDEIDLTVEDSIAIQSKRDEVSFAAKSSEKANAFADELEEEKFGKDSSLEEEPTSFRSTSSKKSSRKAMGMSYSDKKDDEEEDAEQEVSFLGEKRSKKKAELMSVEEDGFNQREKKGKTFAKMGKAISDDDDDDGDGGGSSADDHSSDLLFLKRADEKAFLSEPSHATKKKKKAPASGIDVDDNNSPVEAFSSTKKTNGNILIDNFDEDDREDEASKLKQKNGKDIELYKSFVDDDENANILEKDGDEEGFTKANKKKRQMNASKKLHDTELDEDIEPQLDDFSGKASSSKSKKPILLDVDELDGREGERRKKSLKKKNKDVSVEEEYTIMKQKHDNDDDDDDEEAIDNLAYKSVTKRIPPSSKDDDSDEFSSVLTRKQRSGLRKVDNKDLDIENEDADDFMDSSSVSKALTQKSSEDCKYFKGEWTMDSNDPPYMDSTCPWKSVNDEQTCKTTKKSKNWRWQPSECNMKRFRAAKFLKLMNGKSMAFVGDTMAKAQMKSLVCQLAEVEDPTLLYDDKFNQSMSWHFSSSKVTLSLIWSPYLVQHTNEGQFSKLRLDKLDTKWAAMAPTLDVLVLGVGPSFARPSLYTVRNSVVGCYSCQSLSSNMDITKLKEISLYSGFRASMRSSILGLGAVPGFSGIALLLQPFGFEGNGSYSSVSSKMKDIQDEELKKARSRGSIANRSIMEVLHTNLHSVSIFDPLKDLYKPSCLIPSPLADTWNRVLQRTLTRIFTLELDT